MQSSITETCYFCRRLMGLNHLRQDSQDEYVCRDTYECVEALFSKQEGG